MKPLRQTYMMRRIFSLGMIVFVFVPLAGCEEANMAIDSILGRRSPVLSATQQVSSQSLIPAKRRSPGENTPPVVQSSAPSEQKPTGGPEKEKSAGYSTQQGKRSAPGQLSPATQRALPPQEKKGGELFLAEPASVHLPCRCADSIARSLNWWE
jgi:hypothetical protein